MRKVIHIFDSRLLTHLRPNAINSTNPTNSHCELFFLLRSVKQSLSSYSTPVKQSRKGSVLGFQPYEPNELYELNKPSFLPQRTQRTQRSLLVYTNISLRDLLPLRAWREKGRILVLLNT